MNGGGGGGIPETLALTDLSDVSAKSGTGTTVLMQTSSTLVTPVRSGSMTNFQHTHGSADEAGTLAASAIQVTGYKVVGRNSSGLGACSELDLAVTLNQPAADHAAGTQVVKDLLVVGENVVFGDLLYMKSDTKYWKADANSAATMPGLRMALEDISASSLCFMLVCGYVRDDSWNWTIGGLIYASGTAGALTQTPPAASGDQVQVVGVATHSDMMFFNPSPVIAEVS